MNRLKKIKKVLGKIDMDDVEKLPNRYPLDDLPINKKTDILIISYLNDFVSVEDAKFYLRAKRKIKGTDKLQWKVKFKKEIEELSVDGKVAIVCGGIDCDHARWDNRVRIVDANLTSVIAWENNYMSHAEGAQWYDLKPMDYALSLNESSRDLAMEAFEDGHPHVIYG